MDVIQQEDIDGTLKLEGENGKGKWEGKVRRKNEVGKCEGKMGIGS